jgi:hypothetical protein
MKTTQSFSTAHWFADDAPLWVALIARACGESTIGRAQRVPAAQEHLLRWRSSTISPYRLRRAALQPPLRRSERGLLHFHHGLLTPQVAVSAVFKLFRQILEKGK